ncbi:MAG TPA: phosphoribosylformylglycinamidine synthase [Clostridiales bacterium]|nr:phosphoribosylformylglycinamidine synthase [Clostridiales bacterium]
MVKRLFVEKKPGFDIEAKNLLQDLKDSLGITAIQQLRIFNRYDVEGLSDEDFLLSRNTIFSEPNVDTVYDEELDLPDEWNVFAVELLPGQYDQRADSAAQCIQLLTQGERPKVVFARVIALKGDISIPELEKIKKYLVNPVDSQLASMEKPATLTRELPPPEDVKIIEGFINMDDSEIAEFHQKMGFAMSIADLCFCRDYFKSENRNPYETELKVIDTYWSDHCRHTTFNTKIENIEIEKGKLSKAIEEALKAYLLAREETVRTDKDITLMDMATMGMRLLKKRGLIPDLDESDEINACSIQVPVEIDGRHEIYLVQFKNETHNHPTEIEPFGGAATCLGGAIRDPLSGRAYVYQAMRVTGSGDPTVPFEKTLPGKLSQKTITTGAAKGYSSYGNQVGLATGQVVELYHPGYVAKRLEIGAVIGASPKNNVVRGVPSPGDVIVLLGGRTGRDGCGGATGSSKAHDLSSIETCGAEVQKGNPPTERKLQRLFRNPEASRLIKRCNDFGAGGVCVAIGELADGLNINLDLIPKKYEGLNGTELAISESQERMAVVLAAKDVDKFIKLAAEENLEATPVATVSSNRRLHMTWRGRTIVDISRDFLNTNGVTQTANAKITAVDPNNNYRDKVPSSLEALDTADAFIENLKRLEVCCQKGLVERFDSSIGAGTVLMPFGGKYQLTPEEAMVAKIPVENGQTDTATAMSYGFIPALTEFSPFHGSAFAVMESLAKLAAVGANPSKARLTFQEYFEKLYDKPERWGKVSAALLGAFMAQREMGVPSIGGKDSMSGSFENLDVPPTLVSFAVGITSAAKTGSAALKKSGSTIVLLPLPVDNETLMPDFRQAKRLFDKVSDMVAGGRILSASVVKEGGAAACVAKMAFGNRIGVDFATNDKKILFAPLAASFVVEVEDTSEFSEFNHIILGKTNSDGVFNIGGRQIPIDTAIEAWCSTLEPIFPQKTGFKVKMEPEVPEYTRKPTLSPAIKTAKPRVFIPVFPGTNCEYDTARAFEEAGAETNIFVIKNLTPTDIEESIKKMAEAIDDSQIIMIPGGFSGGDEPDGSGKFIATVFRHERIKQAVENLLNVRDGLILGICNGFQALIKLGLVPYGEIREQKPDDPTLTFNTLGRHVSKMVYTKITSVKSPWLYFCEPGEIYTIPVSHGEGRFIADDKMLKTLIANGQIATQYVDLDGNPTDDIEFNPNGSICAIEGITSPDGRVFGKMGHSERKGTNCYKNVPGSKDQKLFESGVRYFK